MKLKSIVGPNRVIPLCALASQYPYVEERLHELTQAKPLHTRPLPVFYVLTGKSGKKLSSQDTAILDAVKDHPLDATRLCEKIDQTIYTLLENKGLIMKSSLTPTDIMHIKGDFTRWNVKASSIAVQILSNQFGIGYDRICSETYRKVVLKIYETIVLMLLEKNQPGITSSEDLPFLEYSSKENNLLQASFTTSYTICGLGAPAKIFIPHVAKLMHAKAFIPEYASVANAIGAVTGKIISIEEGTILPRYESHALIGYMVRTRKGSTFIKELDDAMAYAKQTLREDALSNAMQRGGKDIKTDIQVYEERAELLPTDEEENNSLLVEVKISARAIGSYDI